MELLNQESNSAQAAFAFSNRGPTTMMAKITVKKMQP
jgi:hypothetical protein